ncbi:C40 family peptidase [Halarcobacter anaerophilus]|uniref:Glycoside hydrolase n=1 Tax=Halarcobacter anaerophilus TaxID=877500 RepID=A0A4Q0Y6F3_9BACT|nr:SH3 domain-containing C40 family peptidase [Halarcobacter anaerophilus]QDF29184.1 NlpC/P60 family lipoprotein (SH3b1, SH3b2 type SH3 domains) [Halarcobacter anaerophilus]RXJ64439.1 hypothetical protein CRV06_00325 [Halarcobacter anaerophilus]
MKFLNIFLLIITAIFFLACAPKNIKIEDIKNYPQNPAFYINNFTNVTLNKEELSKNFIKKYFSPWNLKALKYSKEEASWGNIYAKREIYLENYRLASKQWFDKLIDNANFEKYNTALLKAITTKNCDFRVFPTNSSLFYNPQKAGEGFPFDYNQNSRVKINTPVFVSHFSKDKAWAFVQSHYVLGWVRVDNLLFVNENQIKEFKNNPLYVITQDGFQTFDINLSEDLKIGTFFLKQKDKYLLATNSGIKKVNLNKNSIKAFPLDFNKNYVSKLLNQFITEPYGWGGLNNHRDCSSFTQDFFTPFGIYLNRNSKAQTALNKYFDISKYSNKEKKEFIIKNGIPFLTLVYLRGHIMLYIGTYNNEPLVMHNMWGVKTWIFPFTHGRNIVGKTVITTLEPGVELKMADKYRTILKRVQGIVLLNKK